MPGACLAGIFIDCVCVCVCVCVFAYVGRRVGAWLDACVGTAVGGYARCEGRVRGCVGGRAQKRTGGLACSSELAIRLSRSCRVSVWGDSKLTRRGGVQEGEQILVRLF